MTLDFGDVLLRIGAATACGLLIGLEREWRGQPAGIRTHVVLAVGACLAMILGLEIAASAKLSDPQRIPAQVISGVGFLGAGAILRFGMNVHGLTTATSLWTVSVIGLVCGNGFYLLAACSTMLLFAALTGLRRLWYDAVGYQEVKRVQIVAVHHAGLVRDILSVFDKHHLFIDHLGIEHNLVSNELEISGHVRIGSLKMFDELVGEIQAKGEIRLCKLG
ncbi:MAG: MgtC/SapB family protein [Planctomycetota bacterium]